MTNDHLKRMEQLKRIIREDEKLMREGLDIVDKVLFAVIEDNPSWNLPSPYPHELANLKRQLEERLSKTRQRATSNKL